MSVNIQENIWYVKKIMRRILVCLLVRLITLLKILIDDSRITCNEIIDTLEMVSINVLDKKQHVKWFNIFSHFSVNNNILVNNRYHLLLQ